MKNSTVYIITSFFFFFNTFSQTKKTELNKKEKTEAINALIQNVIRDKYQEIIIVENKVSPNEILRIFKGNIIKDDLGNFIEKEEGVKKPLFNEKYFNIMERKYRDTYFLNGNKNFATAYWKKDDFGERKIILENFEDVFLKLQKGIYFEKPEIQILALSEPIYYKNKDYIVIGVMSTSYIVIMKKANKKWDVVNKTIDYVME
jgi:hypothetical protein